MNLCRGRIPAGLFKLKGVEMARPNAVVLLGQLCIFVHYQDSAHIQDGKLSFRVEGAAEATE